MKFLSFAALAFAFAPRALAQCNEWSDRFALPGVNGTIHAQVVYDDGSGPSLYVAGQFTIAGGERAANIARWDGTRWYDVGGGLTYPTIGFVDVVTMLVWDDGSGPALYAGGFFAFAGSTPALCVARWNGSTWSALGAGLDERVQALAVFDDGSGPALYAGGNFTSSNGAPRAHIARFDGANWNDVGGGTSSTGNDGGDVVAMLAHDDGSGMALYVAGGFDRAGTTAVSGLARWNGTAWSAVGTGALAARGPFVSTGSGPAARLFVGGIGVAQWDGVTLSNVGTVGPIGSGVGELALFDPGTGVRLYGVVHAANSTVLKSWDGVSWTNVAGAPAMTIDALATVDLGVGARLSVIGRTTNRMSATVAHFDGAGWTRLDELDGIESPTGGGSLAVFDDGNGPRLYTVGARWDGRAWSSFSVPAAISALRGIDLGAGPRLGAATSSGVLAFDGATWSSVGSPLGGWVLALAFDAGGGGGGPRRLAAGGRFTGALAHVAEWNGSAWQSLGIGVDGDVESLAYFDDGSGLALYAGGRFTHAGGQLASHVARWDGTSWSPLGAGVDSAGATTLTDLAVFDDGTGPALYAAGRFSSAGGAPASAIARWDGAQWSALGSGLSPAPTSLRMAVHDDGNGPGLFVVGDFRVAGGLAARGVAVWRGGAWHALGRGIDGLPGAVASYDDGSGGGADLCVGGNFSVAGSSVSVNFAVWTDCASWATPFCGGEPLASPCPCGNSGAARHGCANSSFASGAQLEGRGIAHVSNDSMQLTATNMSGPTCLFFNGDSLATPLPFGDGVRCTGGTLRRMGVKSIVLGSASYPQPGDLPLSTVAHVPASGATCFVQAYYRDANVSFCTSATSNATNAIAVSYRP